MSSDTKLPRYVRKRADGFQMLAAIQPSLVLDSLEVLRQQVLPDLVFQQIEWSQLEGATQAQR
ncbi:MAG: hypothetical protein F4X48_02165 [Acidimicrobiia bacterium]|nr:hypothetical protein [Acidimicrobiia bacterium]MYC57385.1 hypothetical protein [Acidimicrobiia bacterium]